MSAVSANSVGINKNGSFQRLNNCNSTNGTISSVVCTSTGALTSMSTQSFERNVLADIIDSSGKNNQQCDISSGLSSASASKALAYLESLSDTRTSTTMMFSGGSITTDPMGLRDRSIEANSQNPHSLLIDDQSTMQLAFHLDLEDSSASTVCALVETPISFCDKFSRTHDATIDELKDHQQSSEETVIVRQGEPIPKFDSCSFKVINSAVTTETTEHINSCINCAATSIKNITVGKCSASGTMWTAAMNECLKKSQNMTECVPVPSSEHVAEIVGRQGCKIKALRAKTNTYIKTPVRGEEPVFVVTGRKEDVSKAKREILSAAEHFSLIRASRKSSVVSNLCTVGYNCGDDLIEKTSSKSPSIPGQVTIQVRVPYRVVGLVVGPKGTTIKYIQHQTQTYIITPSREKEPIFEVTGLPGNVQSARKQIEAHITLRTGNLSSIYGRINNNGKLPDTSKDLAAVDSSNFLSHFLNDSGLLASVNSGNNIRSVIDYRRMAYQSGAENDNIGGLESLNSISTNDFNMSCLDTDFGAKHYINLVHSDNFVSHNSNKINETLHSFNDPKYCCNVNGNSSERSNISTGIGFDPHVQRQLQLCSPFQPAGSLKSQLQTASGLTAVKKNMAFGSKIESYMPMNFYFSTTGEKSKAHGSTHILPNIKNTNNKNKSKTIGMARSHSSASSTASSKSANNSGSYRSNRPELINIWKSFGKSLDLDEGISDSLNMWNLPKSLTALTSSHCSPSTSISPTDSLLGEISSHNHNYNLRLNSSINKTRHEHNSLGKKLQKDPSQTDNNNSPLQRLECILCNNKKINAISVPCGHNIFCTGCAQRIFELGDEICPICSLNVYHATNMLS